MSEALKPCPLCGSNNIHLHQQKGAASILVDQESYIECRECHMQTGRVRGGTLKAQKEKLVKDWNNAENARLRAERNELRFYLAALMPYCLDCGRLKNEPCPAGSPGCALGDDLSHGTPEMVEKAKAMRREVLK